MHGQKILVVDDIEICSILHNFLTLKGYEAYTAWNGMPQAPRKLMPPLS